ncbi:MAG: hypothetical protein KME45_27140 [Stenomitos rutilans HA7619-LM2]|jgi:hypothetical protein|nr:hypothetical protein [Stenomitos rutilans HA7619-LM2]
MSISPNVDDALALDSYWYYCNNAFLGGLLTLPKLSLLPLTKVDAQFIRDGHKHPVTGETCHELQLNQELIIGGKVAFYQHLVHLMVHQWQYEKGEKKPTKHDHNAEFVRVMNGIGFESSANYGRSLEFTPEEGGRFMRAVATAPELALLRPSNSSALLDLEDSRSKPKKDRKTTYCCPQCQQKTFGGKNLQLICGRCNEALIKQVE